MVYILKWLILQTIHVLNKEILPKKSAVYNQEWFQIKSGLQWHAYGNKNFLFAQNKSSVIIKFDPISVEHQKRVDFDL